MLEYSRLLKVKFANTFSYHNLFLLLFNNELVEQKNRLRKHKIRWEFYTNPQLTDLKVAINFLVEKNGLPRFQEMIELSSFDTHPIGNSILASINYLIGYCYLLIILKLLIVSSMDCVA